MANDKLVEPQIGWYFSTFRSHDWYIFNIDYPARQPEYWNSPKEGYELLVFMGKGEYRYMIPFVSTATFIGWLNG